MRFWVGPVLVLLIGLIIVAYIHDGPPYWEWSDFFDNSLHHEKIIGLLVSASLIVYGLGRK